MTIMLQYRQTASFKNLIFLILDKVVNKGLLKMKKTEKLGLTANQERLQSILEYKKYRLVKRNELISLISNYQISKNPRYLIKSMLLKKRLVSFKKGCYIVIQVSSVDKNV